MQTNANVSSYLFSCHSLILDVKYRNTVIIVYRFRYFLSRTIGYGNLLSHVPRWHRAERVSTDMCCSARLPLPARHSYCATRAPTPPRHAYPALRAGPPWPTHAHQCTRMCAFIYELLRDFTHTRLRLRTAKRPPRSAHP